MSSISIDKPLAPGEKATFIVEMSFFGYSKQMEFELTVPNAAPLLSRVDNIRLESKKGPDKPITPQSFNFSKYAKAEDLSGTNAYRLKIYLNNTKQANKLKPGEEVVLNSSAAQLAQLNGRTFKVIPSNIKKESDNYVHLRVNKAYQPTVTKASASGTLSEITGTIPTKTYTVIIPNKVFKGLISERIPGKAAAEGMVEDIPIYAFKRFSGKNKASIKRKLMMDGSEINEKSPPDRTDVLPFRGKVSYSRSFDIDDEEKFIFYVAIARYIYDGDKWTKQWVQTDSSDNVIWGRAVEKK